MTCQEIDRQRYMQHCVYVLTKNPGTQKVHCLMENAVASCNANFGHSAKRSRGKSQCDYCPSVFDVISTMSIVGHLPSTIAQTIAVKQNGRLERSTKPWMLLSRFPRTLHQVQIIVPEGRCRCGRGQRQVLPLLSFVLLLQKGNPPQTNSMSKPDSIHVGAESVSVLNRTNMHDIHSACSVLTLIWVALGLWALFVCSQRDTCCATAVSSRNTFILRKTDMGLEHRCDSINHLP
eukprot:867704-Amphidinium_carterae.2